MAARTIITLLVICLYALGVNLYIYELTHSYWDISGKRLLNLYINLFAIVFYLIDRKAGIVGVWHKEFNRACILLVIANYFLWILNWHGFLGDADNPVADKLFRCFDGSVLVVTIVFIICGIRHKTFKYY